MLLGTTQNALRQILSAALNFYGFRRTVRRREMSFAPRIIEQLVLWI